MEYIKGRGAQFNIPNSFLKTSIPQDWKVLLSKSVLTKQLNYLRSILEIYCVSCMASTKSLKHKTGNICNCRNLFTAWNWRTHF